MHAVAYIDWGRWVANCPAPPCSNALKIQQGQEQWECRYQISDDPPTYGGCGTRAPIDWPADPAAVMAPLLTLSEADRHWHPDDDRRREAQEKEQAETDAAMQTLLREHEQQQAELARQREEEEKS